MNRAFPELDVEEEEALKAETRERCREDLFFLARQILGYDRVTDHIHKRMARDVSLPDYRFKLLLWPRGHFKSTIATESGAIHRLLNDPTERILITNAKLGNSRKFLSAISDHFKQNAKFRWAWRDWWINQYATQFDHAERGDDLDWVVKDTQDEFTLLRPGNLREASITTAGVGASMVSQHYSSIIADDLVNREYVGSSTMVEKSILHFKDLLDLLDPEGELIIIGTRWAYQDLYGWIIENFGHRASLRVPENYLTETDLQHKEVDTPESERKWLMSIQPCYDEETGEPIFPEEYSEEVLNELLREKGPYEFGSQYLLNPVPQESQRFKEEWFRVADEIPRLAELDICITVDPAKSLSDDADRSAITVCGYDSSNYMYLLDGINERVAIDELPEILFEMVRQYKEGCKRFYPVGFEAVGFQETYIYNLERMMMERNYFFPIEDIKRRQSSKEERILGLVPRIKNGFYTPRAIPKSPFSERTAPYDLVQRLKNELIRFPFAEFDDLADALADQIHIVTAGRLPTEPKEEEEEKVVEFVHPSIKQDQRWLRGHRPKNDQKFNDAVR